MVGAEAGMTKKYMSTIKIKVIPNASKNKIVERDQDSMKVKITATPDKGKANKELIKFLAKELGINKSKIKIIKGEKSRDKIIEII